MEVDAVAFGLTALTTMGAAGGAWGATRTRIKRTEADIAELEASQRAHEQQDMVQHTDMVQRLTRIETLVKGIADKL